MSIFISDFQPDVYHFLLHNAMLALYMLSSYVCLSVCFVCYTLVLYQMAKHKCCLDKCHFLTLIQATSKNNLEQQQLL